MDGGGTRRPHAAWAVDVVEHDPTSPPATGWTARDALALVDRLEATAPAVDEAERERLRVLAEDGHVAPRWRYLLAERAGALVGYAGLVLPGGDDEEALADLAIDRASPPMEPLLGALLEAAARRARAAGAPALRVWMRAVEPAEVAVAGRHGLRVERRLGVLARDLRGGPDVGGGVPPTGVEVRPFRPGTDDAAVVEVLAAAYAGTEEAGWDLDTFRQRQALDWFRAEDLLLAWRDGRVVGLHWMKRRSSEVGEVHNLAVHPDGQGGGLGPVLLAAGLTHLRDIGCREALLWVDLANERAVRVYERHGFALRWMDVALAREL